MKDAVCLFFVRKKNWAVKNLNYHASWLHNQVTVWRVWGAKVVLGISSSKGIYSYASLGSASSIIPRTIQTAILVLHSFFVPGNLLTVLALMRCPKLRTHATTMFVISLALSDFLFAAVNLPLTASRYVYEEWRLGAVLCRLDVWFFRKWTIFWSWFSFPIIFSGCFPSSFTETLLHPWWIWSPSLSIGKHQLGSAFLGVCYFEIRFQDLVFMLHPILLLPLLFLRISPLIFDFATKAPLTKPSHPILGDSKFSLWCEWVGHSCHPKAWAPRIIGSMKSKSHFGSARLKDPFFYFPPLFSVVFPLCETVSLHIKLHNPSFCLRGLSNRKRRQDNE